MSLKKKRRGEKWQRRRKDAAGSIKIKHKLHLREDKSLWIKLQETDMCKCVSVFVTDVSREQTSKVIQHFLRSGQQKEKNSWNYKKKNVIYPEINWYQWQSYRAAKGRQLPPQQKSLPPQFLSQQRHFCLKLVSLKLPQNTICTSPLLVNLFQYLPMNLFFLASVGGVRAGAPSRFWVQSSSCAGSPFLADDLAKM